jgi:hypothetical protein
MQIAYRNRNIGFLKPSGACILVYSSERKYRMIMSCVRRLRVKHEGGGLDRILRRPAFVRMVWRIRVQESIGPLIPSPTALRYLCAVLIRALIGFGADYRGTRDCTTSKDLAFPCANDRQRSVRNVFILSEFIWGKRGKTF